MLAGMIGRNKMQSGLQEAWPLGKLLKPSSRSAPGLRQIVHETRLMPSSTWPVMPPTVLVKSRERSGLHRASMSGLGFPTRFLVPSEMKNAMASDRARPIQPAFHSQSLRRSSEVLDIFSWAGPTPMNRAITKMMTAGAINETTTSTAVEIFSLMTHGKLMVGSARSKGRLLGVMSEKAAPTPAIALGTCQHWHSFF